MVSSLRGAGRIGLVLGVGVLVGIGGAWIAAGADEAGILTAHPTVKRVAQKVTKKKGKAGKKGKADAAMPKGEDEAPSLAEPDDKSLKFSRDIAPVLVGNCIGCHNSKNDNAKAAALDLTTFEGIMKGTAKRKVVVAGKPDDSPLILRVRGDEQRKMPPGNNMNLADETIEKLEAWVKDGALLDGKDPAAPIKSYAQTPADALRAELSKLTPAQRNERVEAVALERWKKISPDATPTTTLGAHFALFSVLPKERATALVKVMDAQFEQVRKLLTPPGIPALDGPLKISLYVFNDANGLVELARALENRDPEPNTVALAKLTSETPYLAAVDPLAGRDEPPASKKAKAKKGSADSSSGPERTLAGLLTEQLAAASVASAKDSKAPKYVALGVGAYFASRVEPGSPYYNHLRAEAFQQFQLGWAEKAREATTDVTDEDKLRAAGFSLFEWLAKQDRGNFNVFVRGMLGGSESLEAGTQQLWGVKRDEFTKNWGAWISASYARAR